MIAIGAGLGLGALAWYLSRRMCGVDIGPFQRPAEAFAPQEPVTQCEPSEKPGVRAFRSWILRTFGGRAEPRGISRACEPGKPPSSAHHEGRAWDWFPPDRATAEGVIACLLQTRSVPAELARRAGLRNIIYWERTWNAGRQALGGDGWARYKHAGNPSDTLAHRDHVHFAFSWEGANQRTSLYDVIAPSEAITEIAVADLGQVSPPPPRPTEYIGAARTPASDDELRDALMRSHRAQLGSDPPIHRVRMAWAMVRHETANTHSMWNHNVGNIACTKNFPQCHALNVANPAKEPVYYRSYPDLDSGAADFWRLIAGRYADSLPFFDKGDAFGAARALKSRGYFGQDAEIYGRALDRHARVWDGKYGPPSAAGGSALSALLVIALAGGGLYAISRGG